MSDKDPAKTAQDAIMQALTGNGLTKLSGAMDMMNDIIATTNGAFEGADMPPEVAEAVAAMAQMHARVVMAETGRAGGDLGPLTELSDKIISDMGLMPEIYAPDVQAVFDAITEGDLAALKATVPLIDINEGHGKFAETVLYEAMTSHGASIPIISFLLEAGADPNKGLSGNSGVLHGAGFAYFEPDAVDDLTEVIKRCIAAGADIEQRTEKLGWTPLHTAVAERNLVATEALLRNGAQIENTTSVDARARYAGKTALEMAIAQPDLFALLLAYGADPLVVDHDGKTIETRILAHLQVAEDGHWRDGLAATLSQLHVKLRRRLE